MHSFRLLFLVFSFCFSSFLVLAQRDPMRFGKISDDEFGMQRCEIDTTAKAVILGDYGTVEIRYGNTDGFEYHYRRHMRVKIFDKDASDLGDFKIYLYGNSSGQKEKVTSLKAEIYTKDNGRYKKTKFKRSQSFVDEVSDNLTTVNFSLPNIEEGTIFELEYTIKSPFLFTLPTWYFQSEYPKLFSEFRTYIPEYFFYKPLMQGFLTLTDRSSNSKSSNFEVVWREESAYGDVGGSRRSQRVDVIENSEIYRIDNVPAFKTEPHMNSVINYLSKIEHELSYYRMPQGTPKDYSSTWEQLNKSLLESESFGKHLQRSGFLSEEAGKIKNDFSDPEQRLIAAFDLVQNYMTWDNSASIYAGRNLRRSWSDKKGSAADINLTLVVLLRELDIDADPVILSTRSNGIINPAQIMLEKFNYVAAHALIDGNSYILDATDKHTPYYLLPERCINGQGRLISETNGRWVDLEPFINNITYTQSTLKIKECGSVEAQMIKQQTNYSRLRTDEILRSYDKLEDYMDRFEADHDGMELIDFQVENQDNWAEALESHYKYEIPDANPGAKDIILVNALQFDCIGSNPFRLEERLFPVDFIYPFKRVFNITIDVPEGYEIDEMPATNGFALADNDASYQSRYVLGDDGNIKVIIQMNIAKPIFLPTEYRDLKDFYAKVVEEQARNIILKKI
jgi:hypothetical protein